MMLMVVVIMGMEVMVVLVTIILQMRIMVVVMIMVMERVLLEDVMLWPWVLCCYFK